MGTAEDEENELEGRKEGNARGCRVFKQGDARAFPTWWGGAKVEMH